MTLTDVLTASEALAAAGTTPSGNTVLAYLKARGMPGSKRTVLKLLRQLDHVPTPAAASQALPAPVRPYPEVPEVLGADDAPVYHSPAAETAA
jgi:hypothetical protein